jgi:osmotically-inducible protein OsmY
MRHLPDNVGEVRRATQDKVMMTDTLLRDTVQAELGWEPRIDAGNIGVTARSGVVTLTGNVPTFAEKYAAETAARRVKGVKAVADEVEVRLPFSGRRDDRDIATAIADRFAWDTQVPHDRVRATVEKGRVVLTGEVNWQFQKEAAEDHVRYLLGVVGVSNQLRLRPRVKAEELSDDIAHALNRSWFFDPETIHVTVEGGKVRLTGTAHSPHDRMLAGSIAWTAPGTSAVENDIVVA